MKKSKSQTVLAYAILIAAVIAAFFIMSNVIKRGAQGTYKRSADQIGGGEQITIPDVTDTAK